MTTHPGMMTLYAVKHEAENDAECADQMRRENQESFDRLSHLLDLYRMGAYELAKCRYCEKTVPITDLNTKGICTGCEMEGK